MVDWYFYPLMIAAGFAAGFINTLAGSGSILTLPLLIFMGLPANVANATNRVAILFQNAVSTTSFHRSRVLDVRGAILLGIPAVIGSVIGALIAAALNELVMRRVIGVVMLMMAVLIVLKSDQWIKGRLTEIPNRPDWKQLLIMFVIGIYGGFIQLGVGVFIL
ncbi:MAG: sulfite exporter TauE/SafE family protein, partial [Anaerolineaceae bacterium]